LTQHIPFFIRNIAAAAGISGSETLTPGCSLQAELTGSFLHLDENRK
jgi:hypothetical protein